MRTTLSKRPPQTTVIRLIFVVKIFSYAENIRNYFTRNFCYNEYFSDEYLEQSAYAVHAVFVALRILEGYRWTHVYDSLRRSIDGLPDPKGSLFTTIPSAAIASANREDRHLAEFGGHTPRYCTAYRASSSLRTRGTFSRSSAVSDQLSFRALVPL